MLVLGLGSNIGQRMHYLRMAIAELSALPHLSILKLSAVYESEALLPEQAITSWQMNYLNMAVLCETSYTPHELLGHLKNIEKIIGREGAARWAPRVIDIDILAWDNLILHEEDLKIPHPGLKDRPFALWPLCDVAPTWVHPEWQHCVSTVCEVNRFSGQAPLKTRQMNASIAKTQWMGVINVTPDSFSDGGLALQADAALLHAQQLINEGATVLDIGAESTRPGATPLAWEVEWERLAPVLELIRSRYPTLTISIDTYHPETATRAIQAGANWINDVSGFANPAMIAAVCDTDVEVVLVHSLHIPENRDHFIPKELDPVQWVLEFAENRIKTLENAGISKERIIFDVGIGFGKQAEQSLALLKSIEQFHRLGVRLLVGHSRKTFMSLMTDVAFAERDLETAVMSCRLAEKGVHYLRVHHPAFNRRALLAYESMA